VVERPGGIVEVLLDRGQPRMFGLLALMLRVQLLFEPANTFLKRLALAVGRGGAADCATSAAASRLIVVNVFVTTFCGIPVLMDHLRGGLGGGGLCLRCSNGNQQGCTSK
jgi:hypothetical protein